MKVRDEKAFTRWANEAKQDESLQERLKKAMEFAERVERMMEVERSAENALIFCGEVTGMRLSRNTHEREIQFLIECWILTPRELNNFLDRKETHEGIKDARHGKQPTQLESSHYMRGWNECVNYYNQKSESARSESD